MHTDQHVVTAKQVGMNRYRIKINSKAALLPKKADRPKRSHLEDYRSKSIVQNKEDDTVAAGMKKVELFRTNKTLPVCPIS